MKKNKPRLYRYCLSFFIVSVLILLLSFPASSLEDEGSVYSFGIRAFNDGLYDMAVKEFEKYLAKFPAGKKKNQVHFFLAESFFTQKNYTKAVKNYQQVLRDDPEGPFAKDARLMLGKSFYRDGQYASAVKEFEAFLRKWPEDPLSSEVAFWKGESLFSLGDFPKAAAVYEDLLARYPKASHRDFTYYSPMKEWVTGRRS